MSDSPVTAEAKSSTEAFADYLYSLSKRAPTDGSARAALARLRRTLGRRGVDPMAYREVGPMLPRDLGEREREAYLLVAALYAFHAAKSDAPWFGDYIGTGDSLGVSCSRLRGNSGSMDLRFAALLDARREDLPYRLRQTIALLAAHTNDVGVRYDRLLEDLLAWDRPGRPVQRQWAADYWT